MRTPSKLLWAAVAAVSSGIVLAGVFAMAWAQPGPRQAAPDWQEILGESRGQWPELTNDPVVWRDDFADAWAEAKRTNKPLLVTLRCLPCKQCADFDKDVLEGGSVLDPILNRFVTVRLTTMAGIDFRIFRSPEFQDFDLSWWGFVLSPEGRIYAVFGGRDEVSDATRISLPAFTAMLSRALNFHYDPRRAEWERAGVVGELPVLDGEGNAAQTPESLPGYESWKSKTPAADKDECYHCHQVAEVLRQPAIDAGTFDAARELDMWPLPENVGITVDRDHGLRVTAVESGSAAHRAGIREGDVLAAADGRILFGQADFRGVLHRGPRGAGSIAVVWKRGDRVMSGTMRVRSGWRQTVLHWRMSVSQGNIGTYPTFWANAANANERRRVGVGDDAMAFRAWVGPQNRGAAAAAGLRNNHIVIAVNGERPNIHGREFQTWFRLKFKVGDEIVLTVRTNANDERQIRYRLPGRGE